MEDLTTTTPEMSLEEKAARWELDEFLKSIGVEQEIEKKPAMRRVARSDPYEPFSKSVTISALIAFIGTAVAIASGLAQLHIKLQQRDREMADRLQLIRQDTRIQRDSIEAMRHNLRTLEAPDK